MSECKKHGVPAEHGVEYFSAGIDAPAEPVPVSLESILTAHHPVMVKNEDPEDWVMAYGQCSCGEAKANGTVQHKYIWAGHMKELLQPLFAAQSRQHVREMEEAVREARYKSANYKHGCYVCGKQGTGKDRHFVLLCDEHMRAKMGLPLPSVSASATEEVKK